MTTTPHAISMISMNETMNNTDLDKFVAVHTEHLLGFSASFVHAVLTIPTSDTSSISRGRLTLSFSYIIDSPFYV